MKDVFLEFILISRHINEKFNVIPVLYGSLGLQVLTNIDLNPQDIDILVPQKYICEEWKSFKASIEELGYEFRDLDEHDFKKEGRKIAFSFEEDLEEFVNIDYNNLKIHQYNGVLYKLLNLEEYLKVYSKSLEDGYRREKNNSKDKEKIELIKDLLHTSNNY
ncbi:hypothetical protein GOQ27_03475 [Clostridium sp. D2Q-11]|uniref:Uncharacterized protein n=1 Tax=Anaeromonas frigoriresistens TaxID=2683708 RepID=A0A942UV85_9FIRM|nr:hypothetical protein [Anaeromonas frigoriresistens]MBS4537506.1 hypothetical protein [Anaeromonas frigoriresistens]